MAVIRRERGRQATAGRDIGRRLTCDAAGRETSDEPRRVGFVAAAVGLAVAFVASGCARGPAVLPLGQRPAIDRAIVEYPGGLELTPYVRDLTAPSAFAFDTTTPGRQGTLLIVDGGAAAQTDARILAFPPEALTSDRPTSPHVIYPPRSGRIRLLDTRWGLQGPVGGIVAADGEVFVSHRDAAGRGTITAFTYAGERRTVVGGLPAAGDHAVTDVTLNPFDGRLYFGVGSVTNSGVVGLDNWEKGWLKRHRRLHDRPLNETRFNGYRFDTPNPAAGLLGGSDRVVTAPFNPFGTSNQRVPAAMDGKPGGAVYSVARDGGGLRVEAHGIRHPVGLGFNEYGNLFVSNQGMELRGTRPVKDDPDAILRVPLGAPTYYGWPDYSADLVPISEPRFQPPQEMIRRTGYASLSPLIDAGASGLVPPDRETLLRAAFPSLSGASRMDFVGFDAADAMATYAGELLVALAGDRAPFASSGQPLIGPVGYKVVRVNLDTREVFDFVANTARLPAHRLGRDARDALERPVSVRVGPDKAIYVLDVGRMVLREGNPTFRPGSGRLFRLAGPQTGPQPTPTEPDASAPHLTEEHQDAAEQQRRDAEQRDE